MSPAFSYFFSILFHHQFSMFGVPTLGAVQPAPGGIQGSRISLISKSEIRYEGILYSINPEENTVALRNVRMFGTEGRKEGPQIPPGDQLYEFIIFRGSDIKDLTVFDVSTEDKNKQISAQDPAIINAWGAKPQAQAPAWPGPQQMPPPQLSGPPPPVAPAWVNRPPAGFLNQVKGGWGQPQQFQSGPPAEYEPRGMYDAPGFGGKSGYGWSSHGDDYGNKGGRGGYQGGWGGAGDSGKGYKGGGKGTAGGIREHTGQNFKPTDTSAAKKTFTSDFDFEQSNKLLDKDAVAEEVKKVADTPEDPTKAGTYTKDSFFDEISCETLDRKTGGQRGQLTREMRDAQRAVDVETFGRSSVVPQGGGNYRGGYRGSGGKGKGSGGYGFRKGGF